MVSLTVKIGKQVKMSMPQHRGCWPNIQQQNKYGAAPAAAAWPHGAKLQPEKKYCMSLSEKRKQTANPQDSTDADLSTFQESHSVGNEEKRIHVASQIQMRNSHSIKKQISLRILPSERFLIQHSRVLKGKPIAQVKDSINADRQIGDVSREQFNGK